jgi:(hydroxyamino)benzene mutase
MPIDRRLQLIRAGILLFLLALIFGLIFPKLANPRMGLSAHLIGLQGGVFLVLLGLIWGDISLSPGLATATAWLALYGNYGNFVTNVLSSAFATTHLQPIFGSGHLAEPWKEHLVDFGLISISIAVILNGILVLWGLYRRKPA